jgi:hypothetical protein
LFHICLSALIKWMFSIVYLSGSAPEFLQLRPDIVNCGSRGRIRGRSPFSCARGT